MTMRNLYEDCDGNYGKYKVYAGSQIKDTLREAITIAKKTHRDVSFDFNGVTVVVNEGSDPALLHREWDRALSGYTTSKKVGPFPNKELSEEEKKSDAEKAAKTRKKMEIEDAKAAANAARRKLEALEYLEDAPPFEGNEMLLAQFKTNNKSSYGARVVTYAEDWARMMQKETASGKALEDVVKSTSRKADYDGITGYMYDFAVAILAQCWKHGNQLRVHHDSKRSRMG